MSPRRPFSLFKQTSRCQIVVKRGKATVWEGRVESLRRIKETVKEVGMGLECGIGSDYTLWKEGDKIEAFGAQTPNVPCTCLSEAPAASGSVLAADNVSGHQRLTNSSSFPRFAPLRAEVVEKAVELAVASTVGEGGRRTRI